MTKDVCSNSAVPRNAASHTVQRWFSARHTCSKVTSGFFPPEPLGLAGHEGHGYQAQHHVTHQPHVVAPFVMPKADLAFAHADAVLHVPAPKGHTQQAPQ